MRKLLISLLLASVAATPALADPDHNDRNNGHAERSEARSQAHAERSERSAPVSRSQSNGQAHVNGGAGGGGNGFNGTMNAGGQGRFNGVQQGGQTEAVQNEQAAVRNAEHSRGPHIVNNNTNGTAHDWRGGDRRSFNGQQD